MGWLRASVVALLVACVFGLLVLSPAMAECVADAADAACTPQSAGEDKPAAAQLLALINADRASAGLPLMVARDDVDAIALAQSKAMAEAGDIWHNDAYFTAETKRRLGARSLGENVALNRSTLDAHQRLMASPGHHANLVNPKFTVVGLAAVRDAGGIGYFTEDFVEPLPSAAPGPLPVPGPGAGSPEPAPSPSPSAGGGTLTAQGGAAVAASSPGPAPTPTPSPATAPAPSSPTGATVGPSDLPGGGSSDAHHELALGSDSVPTAPPPGPPAHVPLWATLLASAGVVVLAGRLVALGVARRATVAG